MIVHTSGATRRNGSTRAEVQAPAAPRLGRKHTLSGGILRALFADVSVGQKNVAFGIALFLLFGVGLGIPLTIDFFGGSVLTADQYQTWKVIHGYGVFLGFINYFFGLHIDRLTLTRPQKEFSSWSFLLAGLFGALARMTLALLSALTDFGLLASLGEVVFISLGTIVFVFGQTRATS